MEPEGKFSGCAGGLPHPGAERLDRRCPDVCKDCRLLHVCGAVLNAGVYELDDGARIADAVDAAGGFKKNADKDYINLAESLENGVVPSEIADSEPSYNEIDDPSTIIGKPRDVFEAYSLQDYALKTGKKETSTNSVEQ